MPRWRSGLAGQPVEVGGATIAEGIAVRDIGFLPIEVIRATVADVLVVPERSVEEAIALLAEGGKIVAEGAGAVGVAALLAFPDRFAGRRVGVPITGGNIDASHSRQTSCSGTCCATYGCSAWCWKSST